MAGKTFQDLTHPEDLAADLILVNRMIAGEIPQYSLEKRYIRKDGSIVWVNLTVGSAKKANGSIDYFISVVEDITKRKEAEARLKDSENRLRRILDNLFSFVGVLTREGILIEANEAPLRAAGLSREDVILSGIATGGVFPRTRASASNSLSSRRSKARPFDMT